MQSISFERYKNMREVDMLIMLLDLEWVIHYDEVEWHAFANDLVGRAEKTDGKRGTASNEECPTKLELFMGRLISRAEQVRVLTFLRDHAELVADTNEVNDFERECARLISKNIQESQRDRSHGDFTRWPRINLRQIAEGVKTVPPLTKEGKIIAENMPGYPHENEGFPHELVVFVAQEFTDSFLWHVEHYKNTRNELCKPVMSQKKYIEPIKFELMARANRYLYYDDYPAYQVLWAMGVMLRMPHNQNWWIEKFSQGIIDYLNLTRYFSGTKDLMDKTIQQIRALTEQTLPFEDEPAIVVTPADPMPQKFTNRNLIEQLVQLIQTKKNQPAEAPLPKSDYNFIVVSNMQINNNQGPITSIENFYADKH